ncbi:MAG: 3-methyl-2-oxobutanoate hydroxymethyltransferase, partial [Bdellovibrionales bacterium]|nr:3-methyl-2-oxobutanoate hydroxymethyltransferase [Bdellovibrionales bacterium]
LQEAGCFSVVLEAIPEPIATQVTQNLAIPTIGIGAGPYTDGQVLVLQDMLGLNTDFKPKFVRHFSPGAEVFTQGIQEFINSVNDGSFPNEEEFYQK